MYMFIDQVRFYGQAIKYYIKNKILKKYARLMEKEEELKKQEEIKECKIMIEDTIIEKNLNIKWDDLVGCEDVKQKLKETIILPTINPSLFTGLRSPARGVLLFGPPGNGKTMIAKAVASECGKNLTFFNVSSSTFSSSAEKSADKIIKTLFMLAEEKQPAVIFIDELDSILSKRRDDEKDISRRLKNEFLVQFDGVASHSISRVLVLGATNRPFDLDDAILRRFSVRIFLDLPNEKARRHTILKMMSRVKAELSESDILQIEQKTQKFSFADLSTLCREASFEPVREIPAFKLATCMMADIRAVNIDDFNKAFSKVSRSVTDETLERLANWGKKSIK